MAKSPDAFRTISEVAEWLGIQAHVLRFWESKFNQVKPVKRAGGRRYYRPADMLLLGGIRKLLHDDGLTIKGVQKILREQGIAHVSALSHPIDESAPQPAAAGDAEDDTVVQFQGRRTRDGDDGGPEQIDLVLEPEPDDPAPAAEETATETAQETAGTPDPDAAAPEPDDGDEGEVEAEAADTNAPAPTPEPAAKDGEAAALPSFLHRSPPEAPTASDNTPPEVPDTPAQDAAPPAPAVAADDRAAAPGSLTRLARIDALTKAQARDIAPLAQQLRGWLERNRFAGLR